MEVLIVSKTKMKESVCVGGVVLEDNRYVRLLNPGNYNQPANTSFNIGDIWDINFTNRDRIIPPHIEDVVITNRNFIQKIDNIHEFITKRNFIDWTGDINNLYDGCLHWTNSGSGYIPKDGVMPSKSVGFWIPDHTLISQIAFEKQRYRYNPIRYVSYVGFQERLENIPKNTILRVSLSRLFSTDKVPPGYYLQLSGWYLN